MSNNRFHSDKIKLRRFALHLNFTGEARRWAENWGSMARKTTSPSSEADVLSNSRRRCCICFGLNRDLRIKSGQIAHLDKDSSNTAYDNLAFLCLEHHDAYDSRTSQSKNFTKAEVKRYRDELYMSVIPIVEIKASIPVTPAETFQQQTTNSLQEYKREELKKVIIEVLLEIGPVRNLMN